MSLSLPCSPTACQRHCIPFLVGMQCCFPRGLPHAFCTLPPPRPPPRPPRPSLFDLAFRRKKKDWDALNRAVQEEEEKETPEGDAGVMKFFRQLYSGADEETRRAMMKSYQESGGTALSTNWEEVATQDYAKEKEAEEGKGA